MRDHFRYHDTIWCMANRVLQALQRAVEANQWEHYVGACTAPASELETAPALTGLRLAMHMADSLTVPFAEAQTQ